MQFHSYKIITKVDLIGKKLIYIIQGQKFVEL